MDNKATWHDFVASAGDARDQAFDYTADFHSRDLDGNEFNAWIDLGVIGHGYWRMGNLDNFSTSFAQDMHDNIWHFQDHEWKPNIYNVLLEENGQVYSKLETKADAEGECTSVLLDREVWELSDKMRAMIVKKLNLKEDEEVVYKGKIIRKVKKTKKD